MNLDILNRAPVVGDKVIAVNYVTDLPIITTVTKTENKYVYMNSAPFEGSIASVGEDIKRAISHVVVVSQQLDINKTSFPENFI